MKKFALMTVLIALTAASVFAQPIQVEWWYAMGGRLGEKVVAICEDFNKA